VASGSSVESVNCTYVGLNLGLCGAGWLLLVR
jgi:hypothetical protein